MAKKKYLQLENQKTTSEEMIFSMDLVRVALTTLLTKGRILLYKLQAQVHVTDISKSFIKTKAPIAGDFCLVSSKPVIYTNSTLMVLWYQCDKFCQELCG